jgi:hypothetical protein
MVRMIVGPDHKRLLPASIFGGAVFLMLADLVARVLLTPSNCPLRGNFVCRCVSFYRDLLSFEEGAHMTLLDVNNLRCAMARLPS